MAARGRPTALATRLTEPGDVNGFHIFPYSLEHGLVPVQALRKQRNKPPSALPREGGGRFPPPCWPHRAPWPGACSATQMCGAAAKLPGTGAGSTRPRAGAVLGMPQPRGPHGPDRPGEVTPERGGGKG